MSFSTFRAAAPLLDQRRQPRVRHVVGELAVAAGRAGSSDGDGDATAPPAAGEVTEVPASAVASPQALVDWSNAQPTSETQEPLGVMNVTPPLTAADEPLSIR